MTAEAPPAIDLDGLLRRLHLPTVRRLYPDLATRAEAEGMAYRDFLALLIAEEVAHRAQTRIQRCVRRARFPFLKTIDEDDFTFQTGVRLSLLGSALSPEFVTQGQGLIFGERGRSDFPEPTRLNSLAGVVWSSCFVRFRQR
jgi:DNA replication protein DnaC